ncbi:MAG: hypothetical protein QNL43_04755 [Crocinitomicaceae bacterium]|jgi:formate hydrogenlyase subunit 3/multisubunit Na+/H+ antiporter MnhD subunit|tara:strand:- start:11683 stop:12129 length:447 start_codon:yes stop_codon:yes gene_type:complete
MTEAQIHLMTNHFPIILPMIGGVILILSFLLKSAVSRRIGYFIVVLGGLFTIPAFFSGEGAEEIVEHLGKSHDLIHEHEEKAEIFAYLSYLISLVSLVALWMNWKKKSYEKLLFPLVIIGSLGLAVLAFQTGKSGGEISHPEILNQED